MIYPIVTAGALVAKISEQRKGEGSVSLEIAQSKREMREIKNIPGQPK